MAIVNGGKRGEDENQRKAKEKQKRVTAKILGPWLGALPQILRVERDVVVSGEW